MTRKQIADILEREGLGSLVSLGTDCLFLGKVLIAGKSLAWLEPRQIGRLVTTTGLTGTRLEDVTEGQVLKLAKFWKAHRGAA